MHWFFDIIKLTHIYTYAAEPTVPSLGLGNALGSVSSGGPINGNLNSVDTIIKGILYVGFALAGLIAIIMIIIAGFTYLTSGGDQNAIEKSRKTIINSIIGLLIILFAFFIVQGVIGFFHLPIGFSFSDLYTSLSKS